MKKMQIRPWLWQLEYLEKQFQQQACYTYYRAIFEGIAIFL